MWCLQGNLPDFLWHYRLSPSLAHYLHRASLPSLNWKNKRGFPSLVCILLLLTHDSRGFILIFSLLVQLLSNCPACVCVCFSPTDNRRLSLICFNWLFSLGNLDVSRAWASRLGWMDFHPPRFRALCALFHQKVLMQLRNFQSNYCWVCIIKR